MIEGITLCTFDYTNIKNVYNSRNGLKVVFSFILTLSKPQSADFIQIHSKWKDVSIEI
jgi:hypothetical protein